jgi:porin
MSGSATVAARIPDRACSRVTSSRNRHQSIAARLMLFIMLTLAKSGMPISAQAQTSTGNQDLWQRDTLTGDWGGLRTRLVNDGFTFALQQQSELWANITGGLSRGGAADGLLTASLTVDLDKAVGWKGGNLFVSGFQIQGVGPSPLRVGALQQVSSIEATASTKLDDLWFEQQVSDGKFSLRFGQEGTDDELMLSQNAALYLNSSFGFPPLMTLDLPSGGPDYPLATPFVRARYRANDEITLIGAIYNGDPAPPGPGDPQLRDRHGTAFRLDDHTLSFAELGYAPSFLARLDMPATYKLGAWVATGPFADPLHDTAGLSLANPASTGLPLQHATNHAFYAVVDQMLWKKPKTDAQGISVFLQVMVAPDDRNLSDLFLAGGTNWKGPFPARPDDTIGLAVTYVGIGADARHFSKDLILYTGTGALYSPGETVIEATYRAQLAPWLFMQPDVQFVVNPGAGIPTPQNATPLKNDLIFGARVTVNF